MAVPHTNTIRGRNQLFTGANREREGGGVKLSKVMFCIGALSRPENQNKFCYKTLKRVKNSMQSRPVHYAAGKFGFQRQYFVGPNVGLWE
jgi:hypothetical protein